ncbi:MAG: prepilin-type N-terminal cleavage/methylation domain-containing protein, partial [Clostridiales bacterium]|nr:prepilin-type N-terminal cleavage/methylation domain-containing protein [Clostridiales bacterium]
MTNRSIFGRRGRKSRGFTLVELIVILVIIAILAAAGVATALGYIKKTKFDKNNQSAISVYQTAQTALANK